ncbi:hypothetical protein [Caulobacter vibrioides]|uniref:hypothetical protein n=1 Tax=Caulobacter vibrioides TaxID=155892 RepID=UPI000BB4FC41|nr:hypothetical protein [Caulobacter vibrioides]ATC25030.1 hypothetical protein CA608_11085 [Caulobacter vibrioides]PLR09809.1 hypothetical protein CVUC_16535 [Caulobacter vibrioides]
MFAGPGEPSVGSSRWTRRAAIGAILSAGAGAVAACSPFSGGYRFKIEIEIEVGGQRYFGKGVRETVTREQSAWPDQTSLLTRKTRGEAFWIDVPGFPTLFVLLPRYDGSFLQEWNPDLYLVKTEYRRDEFERYSVDKKIDRATLALSQMPALLYFKNFSDPASGEVLAPANIAKVYGSGARVVRASVARTRESVSRGIRRKIPWMGREIRAYSAFDMQVQSPNRYIFNIRHFYSWGIM